MVNYQVRYPYWLKKFPDTSTVFNNYGYILKSHDIRLVYNRFRFTIAQQTKKVFCLMSNRHAIGRLPESESNTSQHLIHITLAEIFCYLQYFSLKISRVDQPPESNPDRPPEPADKDLWQDPTFKNN
jgi:hypothetical protein